MAFHPLSQCYHMKLCILLVMVHIICNFCLCYLRKDAAIGRIENQKKIIEQ